MRRQYTFDTGSLMYHLEIDRANPNVLTGGSPGRIRRVAQYLNDPQVVESDRGLVTVHGFYREMPVTAFSTGMGTASVSITLPEIIEACDDDKMNIIRIGTAGGLQKFLNVGDYVITTWVQRAESTSDKIMGNGYRAESDEEVRQALLESTERQLLDFQKIYQGPARVTDDIYFDAVDSKKREHDVLAVSMEFSAICALRDRYNQDQGRQIKAGETLLVSDVVVADEEHVDMTQFLAKKKQVEEGHIIAGLDALYTLRQ